MPRNLLAYGCAFKCGQRVTVKRTGMVAHEARCIKNPETRSCPTCEHNVFEPGSPASYGDFGRMEDPGEDACFYCAEDRLPESRKLTTGCAFWEAKK